MGRRDRSPETELLGATEVDGILVGVGSLRYLPLAGESVEERNAHVQLGTERLVREVEREGSVAGQDCIAIGIREDEGRAVLGEPRQG